MSLSPLKAQEMMTLRQSNQFAINLFEDLKRIYLLARNRPIERIEFWERVSCIYITTAWENTANQSSTLEQVARQSILYARYKTRHRNIDRNRLKP